VTGAGPAVYGLFAEESRAVAASAALATRGETWVTTSGW
jgi:4-diphosphocytidyl-2C-methyl-D-erythritol kinase